MPGTITDRYQIQCLSCGYQWDTKYSKVPAKCPSCNSRIHNTNNYSIVTRYIHYENTAEEIQEARFRFWIKIGAFFVFFVLLSSLGFWLSFAISVLGYYGIMDYKKKSKNEMKTTEITTKLTDENQEIALKCPNCNELFKTLKINKNSKIDLLRNLICKKCGVQLSMDYSLDEHCGQCGSKVDSDYNFCEECGEEVKH